MSCMNTPELELVVMSLKLYIDALRINPVDYINENVLDLVAMIVIIVVYLLLIIHHPPL